MVLIHCLSWKGEKFLAYTAIIYTSPIPFQNNLFYHTGKLYSGKPLAGPSTCHCNFLHFTSTLSVCGKDTKQASLPSQAVSGWPRFWTRGVSLDYFSTFLKYNKEKFHQRFSLRAVRAGCHHLLFHCYQSPVASSLPGQLPFLDWGWKSWSRQLYSVHIPSCRTMHERNGLPTSTQTKH